MSSLIGLGGASSRQNAPVIYSGLNISTSTRDIPIALFAGLRALSTNAIWYNDFQKHASNPKGKGGSGKGGQFTYTAATITALGEGVIDSIVRAWAAGSTTTTSSLADLNQTFYSGTAAQTPDPWIVTNYPAEARSYAYTSYLFSPKQDLGESASIPDNRYECQRTSMYSYVHTSPGWIDPNTHVQYNGYDILLSDFIQDWLTNPQYGMSGFTNADISSSITQYATYMRAQGLFYSPLLNKQEKGTQVLDRYAQQSNSWIYWDGKQLQFVPLGDSVITGNGVTYTPIQDVAYAFTDIDYEKDGPIKVTRKDPTDCYNRTILTINDRTYGYVSNPLEYRDDTLVDLYGLRDNTVSQADDICDPLVGNIIVQLLGKRAANIRNTYAWKTNYRFIRCLPGTIVTVSSINIGLVARPVRITKIEEDEKGVLSFTAEEFPSTLGTYTTRALPASNPLPFPNANVDPGDVNTPCIVEPDSSYTNGTPFIFIAASGGPQWGGCQVNISFDGTNYSPIGEITAKAIQGVLTANLANASGLDVTHTLSVDCTESNSIPQPVTNADALADRTLSLVVAQPTIIAGPISVVPNNGEFLDFGAVAATGTNTANLTYLPRGRYGSTPSAHGIGDQFTLLDVSGQSGSTLLYPLPPQYIGVPIYVKFLSFNLQNGGNQDLATVVEYRYTPTGLGYGTAAGGVPATPTGLAASGGVQSALVSWAANAAADNVLSYNVYRAPGTGASFGSAVVVQNINALSWNDNSLAANTGYTYFLTAVNSVGESGHTAGVSATTATTVTNQFGFGFDRDLSFGTLGQPFVEFTINIPWVIIAGMGTSEVKTTGTGPSAPTSFPLYVNGVNVGSIDFATSATVATFTKASNTTVTGGFTTRIDLPSSLNGMTGRLFGSVVGTR